MLTQHSSSRLWVAGLVCLLATSASAQERTANYSGPSQAPKGTIQPVIFDGLHGHTPTNYYNPWANYAPGYNTYPTNYSDPNRGYTAYGHTGGWGSHGNCHQHNCAACRANFGRRFRCSMAWLKPLTYWDAGCQTDIIAVSPGYSNPNDLNQGYAAQGYGGPVSVPQAPNIRSNYNYGWGLPSSRLTPTSVPYGY